MEWRESCESWFAYFAYSKPSNIDFNYLDNVKKLTAWLFGDKLRLIKAKIIKADLPNKIPKNKEKLDILIVPIFFFLFV